MTTVEIVPGMAEAIERRRTALGIAKGVLASVAGVSRETLRPVLAGELRQYADETIFGLGRALRWRNDWFDRLREGLDPVEHVADVDLAEEIRTLRQEVARLRDQVQSLGTSADAPRADGEAP